MPKQESPIRSELYLADDGKTVMRRVMENVGGSVGWILRNELEIHPDVREFVDENPDADIKGYTFQSNTIKTPDPMDYTIDEIEEIVSDLESVDVLLKMKSEDERKGAISVYNDRVSELLGLDVAAVS